MKAAWSSSPVRCWLRLRRLGEKPDRAPGILEPRSGSQVQGVSSLPRWATSCA